MTENHHRLEVMYSSGEAVRLTGASYRQLDTWCRAGLVIGMDRAPGSGRRRRFTEGQLDRLRLLVFAARLRSLSLAELAQRLEAVPAIANALRPELETRARPALEAANVRG